MDREDIKRGYGRHDPICTKCARDQGGVWPLGYVSTWWEDVCACCGKTEPITPRYHWNFSDE